MIYTRGRNLGNVKNAIKINLRNILKEMRENQIRNLLYQYQANSRLWQKYSRRIRRSYSKQKQAKNLIHDDDGGDSNDDGISEDARRSCLLSIASNGGFVIACYCFWLHYRVEVVTMVSTVSVLREHIPSIFSFWKPWHFGGDMSPSSPNTWRYDATLTKRGFLSSSAVNTQMDPLTDTLLRQPATQDYQHWGAVYRVHCMKQTKSAGVTDTKCLPCQTFGRLLTSE
jgi:hypothetical protein